VRGKEGGGAGGKKRNVFREGRGPPGKKPSMAQGGEVRGKYRKVLFSRGSYYPEKNKWALGEGVQLRERTVISQVKV